MSISSDEELAPVGLTELLPVIAMLLGKFKVPRPRLAPLGAGGGCEPPTLSLSKSSRTNNPALSRRGNGPRRADECRCQRDHGEACPLAGACLACGAQSPVTAKTS
jgi:hypothetical protein